MSANHLEHHPHVDDNVAADEEWALPVDVTGLVQERQAIHPGLAARQAKHRDEGSIEPPEAVGDRLFE